MAALLFLGYAAAAATFYAVLRSRAPLMDDFDEARVPRQAEIVELFPAEVRKAA